MEKPFWVFAGMDYESSGGVGDFVGRFETIEAAREGLQRAIDTRYISHNWHHIVNVATAEVVECTDKYCQFDGLTVIGPRVQPYKANR